MRRAQKFLLAALASVGACAAQTLLLSAFDGTPAAGAVRAGTSWVGNTTQNAGTLAVGGNARDDNGWGATGLALNATGLGFLTVTAQRDAGNAAATLAIQFEDRNLNTQVFSVSTAAFAVGTLTTVQIPITGWSGGFSATQIAGWSIGGGGVGTTAFRMTFDNLAFNATATPGTTAPTVAADFGTTNKTAGASVTFAVTAAGTAPFTYQWFKNATTPLPNNATATTAALTLATLTPADAGSYTCTVTNAAGSAVSGAFVLTVNALPATVALGNLAATYDGTAKPVSVTTTPAGLAVALGYAGSATPPVNAGSYAVTATVVDSVYAGAANGTLVIARAAQSIAFAPLPATLAVGAPFAVSATATSGGPVAFAVLAGGATLNGTTLTPTAATTITLRATQAGTANYLPATSDLTFSTAKQTQSIDFPAVANQPAGVATLTLAATASSGLPVTFALVSGPATLSGATLTPTGAGLVTVRASQGGNDAFNAAPDVTRAFTVAATAVIAAPVLAQSPASRTITVGDPWSLSVVATGTGPFTYQWFKDGAPLTGATAETLVVVRATLDDAGAYRVEVSNAGGTARSAVATIAVLAVEFPSAPVITRQPGPQLALVGGAATFDVVARAVPTPTFQWRRDGVALPGATQATLLLLPVLASDAAAYDVVVSNSAGSATSSLAPLALATAPVTPVVTRQPASITAAAGRGVSFTAAGSGVPLPTFQWRKDGAPIAGATFDTLAFPALTTAQAGTYTVTLSNSAGAVTSREAYLAVPPRNYAGRYFGALGAAGTFALHIRDDHTGVWLGFTPAPRAVFVATALTVDNNGGFQLRTTTDQVFTGAIAATGAVTGVAAADATLTFRGTRSADAGATQAFAGFYDAAVANSGARAFAIADATGQLLLATQIAGVLDAGLGTVGASGAVRVTTVGEVAAIGAVAPATLALTLNLPAAANPLAFAGLADSAPATAEQRLINNSTRARAGTGDQVAIAGFVITGEESKTVLIRAVGPTLAGFGVTGVLAAPTLELFRGGSNIPLARNAGWSLGGAAPAVAAAAGRAGAFTLAPGTADAALLTTLAPGAYSAVISSADARAGVGLVEVYDLSGAAPGQRLGNLSVRAFAGADADTLIVGVVVAGTVPKRLLLRAVGPGLTAFGVAGALARPQLAVFAGATEVARNAGWSASPDAAAIAAAAAQAGAFPLASGAADSALLISLAPGAYTAQVAGLGGATGVALVEVYAVP
ncbi:MAG: hypothetical protein RLZZ15_1623 [Verrucomicrobiota bacterium]